MYLSRCGLQSNSELVEKGYPDLGWDPVEGERYLDFLRFCVWVNGKYLFGIEEANEAKFMVINLFKTSVYIFQTRTFPTVHESDLLY